MNKRIKVAILFGGRSTEHEVSIRSAKNVYEVIDQNKFEPILIGIDKNGTWLNSAQSKIMMQKGKAPKAKPDLMPKIDLKKIDVVFPVLHGACGEDGTMQGFLKLVGLPYVGPSLLGSSMGMDKDVTKRILKEAGIKVSSGVVVEKHETEKINFAKIKKEFGLPLFVKPANAGSSVGVSKVRNEKEFNVALSTAFRFDTKVLIEEAIVGREIECAVLGNENPIAAIPGEIIPGEEFYSYDDKYASTSTSVAQIPANIPTKVFEQVQKTAVVAYKALELEGMTRVDFFYTKSGKLLINEVNTIPGFTSISMYPKMWEASGVSFAELVTKLITFAIERYERECSLKSTM
jgi:D-alanine-D-alanine ligase